MSTDKGQMVDLAHGTYEINFKNNVLTVSGKGLWSFETSACFAEEMKSIIMKHKDKIYGMVALLSGGNIAPKEVMEMVQKSVEWRIANNFNFPTAFVLLQKEGNSLFKAIFEGVYKNMPVPFALFESSDEAYRWISAMHLQRKMMSTGFAV